MANKFLPFLTDKSQPEAIYEQLIQRSRGVSLVTLAVIFRVLLVEGVSQVRNYVKSLPDMSASEVFQQVFEHYSTSGNYGVSRDYLDMAIAAFQLLVKEEVPILSDDCEGLSNDVSDQAKAVFYLMLCLDNEKYSDRLLVDVVPLYAPPEDWQQKIQDFTEFSDSAPEHVHLKSETELEAYVLSCLVRPEPPHVCLTMKEEASDNDDPLPF